MIDYNIWKKVLDDQLEGVINSSKSVDDATYLETNKLCVLIEQRDYLGKIMYCLDSIAQTLDRYVSDQAEFYKRFLEQENIMDESGVVNNEPEQSRAEITEEKFEAGALIECVNSIEERLVVFKLNIESILNNITGLNTRIDHLSDQVMQIIGNKQPPNEGG